ncbi:OmpA family protein [Jannaschia ovalis]|uniref:OmpA family protein n=1 Tax=Jannaschia ovalis TaxID=3038773 RepID=A0ABY8LDD8_9RHOB|nr:OmpA family protein [Jannaschia sp. GRR-S6-38]WGH79332.1 OmpA family protein [Jannaschia sp. GRR-S6-38]
MKTLPLSRRSFLAGLGLTGLAGCDFLAVTAGSEVDEGAFGNPTMQNMLVMNGSVPAASRIGANFADSVPTTINFAFNSAQLSPTARAVLDQQADFILQFPEVRFSVYGHTDLVGSRAYNERLGRRRAQAAVNYLAAKGVSLSRLEALVSFGEERPLVPTETREPANRRTVTEVAGFVSGHPLVLDGKYAQIVYRRYVAGAGASAEG